MTTDANSFRQETQAGKMTNAGMDLMKRMPRWDDVDELAGAPKSPLVLVVITRHSRIVGQLNPSATQSLIIDSKIVLPNVSFGPPNWTRSRTFQIRFALAL